MKKSVLIIFIFPALLVIFSSCKNEIENLSLSKGKVVKYYESGAYDKDLKEALKPAYDFLTQKIDVKKPAVVFDVDETILSNYNYIKSIDFGYKSELWDEYLMNADAEPIVQTVELYKELIRKNYSVIFLTARPETAYFHTFENLKTVGVEIFDTLICRTTAYKKFTSAEFKEIERKLLQKSGYNIVMCVGDQESDLTGSFTGKKIKLPNKMYLNN